MQNAPHPCNPSRLRINCSSELVSTCLLMDARMSGSSLRDCSTTRWDMSKISVPSNTALAFWARSNHERLFLRGGHLAGSLHRYCFETILVNEPLCDGWVHKAEI